MCNPKWLDNQRVTNGSSFNGVFLLKLEHCVCVFINASKSRAKKPNSVKSLGKKRGSSLERERAERENREVDLHMARKRSSAMNTVT